MFTRASRSYQFGMRIPLSCCRISPLGHACQASTGIKRSQRLSPVIELWRSWLSFSPLWKFYVFPILSIELHPFSPPKAATLARKVLEDTIYAADWYIKTATITLEWHLPGAVPANENIEPTPHSTTSQDHQYFIMPHRKSSTETMVIITCPPGPPPPRPQLPKRASSAAATHLGECSFG